MTKATGHALTSGLNEASWLVGQMPGSDTSHAPPPVRGECNMQSSLRENAGRPVFDDGASNDNTSGVSLHSREFDEGDVKIGVRECCRFGAGGSTP